MKLSIAPETYVNADGTPMAGRVSVLAHDSDVRADVWTLEGGSFVRAQNPVLLDATGRVPSTLFFDASIVDVKVEKFVGNAGTLSVSSPDGDFETFDIFEVGFDAGELKTTFTVDCIEDLSDVPVSVGSVRVLGYYGAGDSASRVYLWDKDATDNADGGYVVRSNRTDEGRWILLYSDETIPSSFYGIFAGTDETNINAFTSIPDTVGSMGLRTSRVLRFEAGNYEVGGAVSTGRDVVFDVGAKFANAEFRCKSARVGGVNGSFVFKDATFTGADAVAHSSWFSTARGFLTCGAKRLVVDSENYFVDNAIDSEVTLYGVALEYPSNTRLPLTYGENGLVTLSKVNIVGERVFDNTDRLKFKYMEFTDKWFPKYAASAFDFTNKINARYINDCIVSVENFTNAEVFAKAIEADEHYTELDFCGRHVGSLTLTRIGNVHDLNADELTMQKNAINLYNVNCQNYHGTNGSSITMFESNITTYDRCNFSTVDAYESRISGISPLIFDGANIEKCTIDCPIMSSDYSSNEDVKGTFTAQSTTFNNPVYAKKVRFSNCLFFEDANVYPYKDGNAYYFDAEIENNVFRGYGLYFAKNRDDGSCRNITPKIKLVGNKFTNGASVKIQYWANRNLTSTLVRNYTFLDMGSLSLFEYSGNVGSCPREDMRGVNIGDNKAYTLKDNFYYYLENNISSFGKYADNVLMKWYWKNDSPWNNATFQMYNQIFGVEYASKFLDESAADNGDFFDKVIYTPDYIRVVQNGSGDLNNYVSAKVI